MLRPHTPVRIVGSDENAQAAMVPGDAGTVPSPARTKVRQRPSNTGGRLPRKASTPSAKEGRSIRSRWRSAS